MAQCWAKGCLDYARQQIDGSLFWKRENECLYTCMHMCVCVCVCWRADRCWWLRAHPQCPGLSDSSCVTSVLGHGGDAGGGVATTLVLPSQEQGWRERTGCRARLPLGQAALLPSHCGLWGPMGGPSPPVLAMLVQSKPGSQRA
jgi:hypothetical protein